MKFKYQFTIKHDAGTHKLSCFANDLATALKMIMIAEKCPERAVVNIKITENK